MSGQILPNAEGKPARGRKIAGAVVLNLALLTTAAALWAWFDYRYVSRYRPPAEMRQLTGWLFNGLPAVALLLNFWLCRRLKPPARLGLALLAALTLGALAWLLFYTLGGRFHLAIGGALH